MPLSLLAQRSLACALLALSAGCSLAPPYQRPDLALPNAWQNPTQGASLNAQWWQSFASPELNALVEEGLGQSFNLQAAYRRVAQARATASASSGSQSPTLSLSADASRGGLQSGVKAEQSVYAQASYELDFWGKNANTARAADALTQASQFDAETVRISLVASIADNYFQILSLQERIRLAQKIADDAQKVLSLVQTQAQFGAASDLEIAQQRNALQTFQAAVPVLRQQQEQALHSLAILLGRIPEGFTLAQAGLDEISNPALSAGLPASLIQQRPDIQAAEARLRAANFDIGVARAALFPDLTLTVQSGSKILPQAGLWSAAAALTQPLWNGGALADQVTVSRERAQELIASYHQTVLQGLQDVEDQLSAVTQLDQLVQIDAAAVQSAEEAARLGQVRFKLGSVDFLNVLTIERTLYQAEDTQLQVKLQRLQATVALYRALGGGFDAATTPPTQTTDKKATQP